MSTSTRRIGTAAAVDPDGRPRRRRGRRGVGADASPARSGNSGVGASLALGAGWLASVVRLVAGVVILIVAAGILLVLLKANTTNSVVSEVHGWARWLAGPFDGMFSLHNARTAIAVNWGIAAVVYLFVSGLIARLIDRAKRSDATSRSRRMVHGR